MAVLSGLAVKLGSLVVRTLSKPVSRSIVAYSKTQPQFRSVFVQFGQWHHSTQYRFQARLLGHRIHKVKPIEEDKALELGAEVVSELLVFGVAGLSIAFEIVRNTRNSAEKSEQEEQGRRDATKAIDDRFVALERALALVELQQTRLLADLHDSIGELRADLHAARTPPPAGSAHS